MQIAGLCKGSTADSDSVCEGSNPSPAAKRSLKPCGFKLLFLFYSFVTDNCRSRGIGQVCAPIGTISARAVRRRKTEGLAKSNTIVRSEFLRDNLQFHPESAKIKKI